MRALTILLFLTTACGSRAELPLEGTAELRSESWEQLEVVVRVRSAPGAAITLRTGGIGGFEDRRASADPSGEATFVIDLGEDVRRDRAALMRSLSSSRFDVQASLEGRLQNEMLYLERSSALRAHPAGLRWECLHPACRVSIAFGKLRLAEPSDATLRVGDVSVAAGEDLEPDVRPFLTDVDLAAAIRDPERGAPSAAPVTIPGATVRFANGHEAQGELAVYGGDLRRMLARAYVGILEGGLDPELAPTGSALLTVSQADTGAAMDAELLGEAHRASDIAYVAVARTSTREVGGCGTYRDTRTRERVAVSRSVHDLTVTVYARATGESLATEVVRGTPPACGAVTFGRHESAAAPHDRARAWLELWLARRDG